MSNRCLTNKMTNTLTTAIVGASGRMGRMLIKGVLAHPTLCLTGAYIPKNSPLLGVDAGVLVGEGACHLPLSSLDKESKASDVVIDFSLPSALDETLAFCVAHKARLVMGVTGLSKDDEQKLIKASRHIAIVYAGNYSVGVNLALSLLATTAKTLPSADVEIIEHHHKHKKDAPSGTALMMANAVTTARHQTKETLVFGRQGHNPRQQGEIGIHAVRGGEIVGEHCVQFILEGEIIEISHKAQDRRLFADGAIRAALWVSDKQAGLYNMQQVLGLS